MISVSALKTALRIETLDDAYDEEEQVAYLEDLEAAAVAFVERKTGWYYGPLVGRVDYLLGSGGQREIRLTAVPIIDPEADPPLTLVVTVGGTEVDAEDFEVRGRVLRHVSGWGYGYGAVDIVATYTAGYEPGEEPADIRQAVTGLVAHWWSNRTPVAVAGASADIPLHVAEIIRLNTRMGV